MSDIQNQKVASAVLASRIDQHVSESNYRQFAYDCALQAATITRAELEAVLRECREALVLTQDGSEFAACLPDEWSFAADKDWNQMKEAIAKLNEVLNEDR